MCEIILGSYEEFILGYGFNPKQTKESTQTFSLHSHAGSIRAVASSGKFLASGGADDRIVVYDLKDRKELCMLTHHSGTLNCLQFTNDHTHLISGSQDGVLSIVRIGNYKIEKLWDKAHKGAAILDLAMHPSGKLLLTLGADSTLRTWNLVKGRQAYAINLNSKSKDVRNLQQIRWSPGGTLFSLIGGKYTEIWSIEIGGILNIIEHESRVNSCEWITDKTLVAGYENGKVSKFNVDGDIEEIHECHKVRVKVMKVHKKHLVTGSSDGEIKVWKLSNMKLVTQFKSGCRLTCITLAEPFKVEKEEEDNEENGEPILADQLKRLKQKAVVQVVIEDDEDITTIEPVKNKKKRKSKDFEDLTKKNDSEGKKKKRKSYSKT